MMGVVVSCPLRRDGRRSDMQCLSPHTACGETALNHDIAVTKYFVLWWCLWLGHPKEITGKFRGQKGRNIIFVKVILEWGLNSQ